MSVCDRERKIERDWEKNVMGTSENPRSLIAFGEREKICCQLFVIGTNLFVDKSLQNFSQKRETGNKTSPDYGD